MTKIVHSESKDGVTIQTVKVELNRPPPPEGWQRTDGGGPVIVAHCERHGITVEPGQIVDDPSDQIMEGGVRIFRDWRMISEGCTWQPDEPLDRAFMIVDGQPRCRVCGQARRPTAG
jgi:hypothetical protein